MSKRILHIQSSIFGGKGVSSGITNQLVDRLVEQTGARVTFRNLGGEDFPHFTANTISAISAGNAIFADQLIREIQETDIIVVGVPMYNFGIPSQLKSWFDHIARAGTTFKYTDQGAVGLLDNKKVYVVTTRGGIHKDQATDVQTPYLKTMFGFLGITDVEFIFAEGLNMGDGARTKGIEQAETVLQSLVSHSPMSQVAQA